MRSINISKKVIKLLKEHFFAVILVIIATFLRIDNLQNNAIFFSDSAHDLIAAQTALQTGHIPLLGIASSVPRFHQGPLSVWLLMLLNLIFGNYFFIFSLVYALIGILAVIFIYEFCIVWINKRVGLLSMAILAISPLAIAQSRMIYHTTPIPIMLIIYLWSVLHYLKNKETAIFWPIFFAGLLIQFELNLVPLFILIPLAWYWRENKNVKVWQIFAGFLLGLAPMLIQLPGFFAWLVYRVGAYAIPSEHTISIGRIGNVLEAIKLYGGRIIGVDDLLLSTSFTILIFIASFMIIRQWRENKLPISVKIITVASITMLAALFVHGSPSEAYFPAFLIFLPIVTGFGLAKINQGILLRFFLSTQLALFLINIKAIYYSDYFTNTSISFNYGPGVNEQKQVAKYISEIAGNNSTIDLTGKYSENYQYWLNRYGIKIVEKSRPTFSIVNNHVIDENEKFLVSKKFDNVTVNKYAPWEEIND